MVAIDEILLRECTGEGWGGGTQICTDSRVHRRNADWSTPPAGTQPLVNNLYQGMTLDAVTGLYYERFRNYSPTLGTWTSQDPLGYINGANTYQFVDSSPVGNADPFGMAAIPTTVGGLMASMVPNAGRFGGSLARQSSVSSLLQLNFVVSKSKKCDCKEIEFIQFVQVAWTLFAFGLVSHASANWELDDKPYSGQPADVPPPFYPYQSPGTPGGAYMTDNPGASSVLGLTQYVLFQEVFATFAVCTKGKDAGHAYGEEFWGQTFHFASWAAHVFTGADSTVMRQLSGAEPPSASGPLSAQMTLTIPS